MANFNSLSSDVPAVHVVVCPMSSGHRMIEMEIGLTRMWALSVADRANALSTVGLGGSGQSTPRSPCLRN